MNPDNIGELLAVLFWPGLLLYLFLRSLKTRCSKCNSIKIKYMKNYQEKDPYAYTKPTMSWSAIKKIPHYEKPTTTRSVFEYVCKNCGHHFKEYNGITF